MAFSRAFNTTALRRCLLGSAATLSLMAGNAMAQEAPQAPVDATPATADSAPKRVTTQTSAATDATTCMETTVTSERKRGPLALFGKRHEETTTRYNSDCANALMTRQLLEMSNTLMTDSTDPGMQALGIEIYLQQSAENRAVIDRMLEERGTSFDRINFIANSDNTSVHCASTPVASPATAQAGAPAQETLNVSFRCTPRSALTIPTPR